MVDGKFQQQDHILGVRHMDPAQFAKFWEEYEARAIELIALAKQD